MSEIIQIEHLKRRFGSCEAVDDLSLNEEGQVKAPGSRLTVMCGVRSAKCEVRSARRRRRWRTALHLLLWHLARRTHLAPSTPHGARRTSHFARRTSHVILHLARRTAHLAHVRGRRTVVGRPHTLREVQCD